MIKRILYTFLPVCLLATGFAGCDDDAVEPLPETVPLIIESKWKKLCDGRRMTLTVKVNDEKNPQLTTNEDFDVYLTAKDGEMDVSKIAFKDFPSMVTVPKGVSSFDIKLPIVESGLEPKQKLTVNVTAFVRGYAMTNPTQTVVVSDHYYTVVSLKNNSDNIINEGDELLFRCRLLFR